MKTLKIAADLTLPIDTVTQTMAILAKRRAGKSYAMRRLTEQLVKTKQQVVVVDPKGDQWGIRSSADGKGPGLPVVILGGERGDVPLEPSGGELVAKLVVEDRVSVLLDLSLFRKHEVATFMTAFLENLYRLKAQDRYRTPLMLVIDEADAIAPQKPQENETRMLGAAEDIVRRGGQRGLGCVLVTQRSAVLNKNVLTQAEILVALRTIAPQDLAAMQAWIDVHGSTEQRRTLMESLPSLPVGDAWFWSPGWPSADGIFKRVHILPIETFDSGATPKSGEKRIEPKAAADVDLEALKAAMAETLARAQADDPKELKKTIAESKATIAKLTRELEVAKTTAKPGKTVETSVLTDADRELLVKLSDKIDAQLPAVTDSIVRSVKGAMAACKAMLTEFESAVTAECSVRHIELEKHLDGKRLAKIREKVSSLIAPARTMLQAPETIVPQASQVRQVPGLTITTTPRSGESSGLRRGEDPRAGRVERTRPAAKEPIAPAPDLNLKKGCRDILAALVGKHPHAVRYSQLALFCGIKPGGSTMSTYMSILRRAGLIAEQGDDVSLTAAGVTAAGGPRAPMSPEELVALWSRRLKRGARQILDSLMEAYPGGRSKQELGELLGGISAGGSTLSTYLSTLRTAGLIDESTGTVRASSELFS